MCVYKYVIYIYIYIYMYVSRASTIERPMGRAKQASPAPPASDGRVTGSALPSVALPVCSATKYVGPTGIRY